jgi:Glu-tRNA(Gln) amidotransferase subunit E-like FAD-binding protein
MKEIEKKIPTIVAIALTKTWVELRRDGIPIENITYKHLYGIFTSVRAEKIMPEAIKELFIYIAHNSDAKIKDAIAYTETAVMKNSAVKKVVKRVVAERSDYIKKHGENSINGLMGVIMKEVRGKTDGKIVKKLLLNELTKSGIRTMLKKKVKKIKTWWKKLSIDDIYLVYSIMFGITMVTAFWILIIII